MSKHLLLLFPNHISSRKRSPKSKQPVDIIDNGVENNAYQDELTPYATTTDMNMRSLKPTNNSFKGNSNDVYAEVQKPNRSSKQTDNNKQRTESEPTHNSNVYAQAIRPGGKSDEIAATNSSTVDGENVNPEMLYAVVNKPQKPTSQTNVEEGNTSSRFLNQDGLMYATVDVANPTPVTKPPVVPPKSRLSNRESRPEHEDSVVYAEVATEL